MEPKTDLAREWSEILTPLTPKGCLPPPGSPGRLVANFAADVLMKSRRFEHVLVTPEFMAGETGAEITRIAKASRSEARRTPNRSVIKCSPETYGLLNATNVCAYVSTLLGQKVEDEYDGYFIYYDEGDFSALHVDNVGPLNLLTCLHHVWPDGPGPRSETYFMESSGRVTTQDLGPGQAVWLHAAQIPHGRTPLGPGEEVILMTLSFRSVERL